MELLSLSLPGNSLLLSGSENGLFLHTMQNQQFGRPLLLCSGYKSGLSACVSGGRAYYTYINKENVLLLRRLYDPAVLFRLDYTDSDFCPAPLLIHFNHTLFLFYFEYDTSQALYRLKLSLPFSDLAPMLPNALTSPYSDFPQLHVQATKHYLYVILTTKANSVAYRYSASASFEPVLSETDLLAGLRLPWESEKAQLEQTIRQSIQLSGQQQALLTEKEQKLHAMETKLAELSSEAEQTNTSLRETTQALQTVKAQLTECEQSRQQTAQTLAHTTLLLERAKAQYAELMQVAEQYRQEAMKWYEKFTDRH